MVKKGKLLKKILNNPKDVSFENMVKIVQAFGFIQERIRGSHHIFSHPKVPELLNLQDVKGKAKPYQVKQFIAIIERHNLHMEGEE